jgi:signal transduction histidine kinase
LQVAAGRSSFVDKVLGRLGRLDTEGVQQVVERLARERNLLETLLQTIEDGVLVTDAQGRVAYLNHAAGRLLGLQPGSASGQPVTALLPELDWAKISALDGSGGPRTVRLELEVQYPRPRVLRALATPLGSEGAPGGGGLALVLHDTSEARRKTVETVESERIQLLTVLAMSVAHEVGNPLNALHIHLQLIEREVKKLRSLAPPAPTRASSAVRRRAIAAEESRASEGESGEIAARLDQYLTVAKGEISRLDYIVTHFLQAIRPTPPQVQPASLNDAVRGTLEVLQPELDNRGLVTETRLARHLPDAAFDPDQIKQALINLIKNSMQAMTKDGRLTVETGAWGDSVWVSVADTGEGIPKEQVTRLFEPLFTTKKKGSGLGLMVVYRIVREHGGRIDVESKPGKGTTFRLWLPLPGRGVRLLQETGTAPAGGAAAPEREVEELTTPGTSRL